MQVTCNFYNTKYPNDCKILSGVVNCNKCNFYLTKQEFDKKMLALDERILQKKK